MCVNIPSNRGCNFHMALFLVKYVPLTDSHFSSPNEMIFGPNAEGPGGGTLFAAHHARTSSGAMGVTGSLQWKDSDRKLGYLWIRCQRQPKHLKSSGIPDSCCLRKLQSTTHAKLKHWTPSTSPSLQTRSNLAKPMSRNHGERALG